MTYHLEALGDERFQKLCQSILAISFPELQCLPTGQPDGGRDAFLRSLRTTSDGVAIFQVKFAKDPASRDAREAMIELIKSERPKIRRLLDRGAKTYHFMTNISGTSHLDVGSIDQANAMLTEELGIPTYCWWRDDIERRIDLHPSLKWSFPEILKATDLLEALIDPQNDQEAKRRSEAVRAYMAYQARYDAQLKFKQIDLQKSILDLFVDVPALIAKPIVGERSRARHQWIEELSSDPNVDEMIIVGAEEDQGEEALNRAPGALQLLVRDDVARYFTRMVIEGAPGQGKSTVTQYLCQVHRLSLLNRSADIRRVAEGHMPFAARVPFRVDLRDYASWLAGRDPFSDDPTSRIPPGSTPVLESFLSAQVHRYTGASFDVGDLNAVARASQILVVLDGFDEVADINLRNRIVAEVTDATERLSEIALSAQVIVTSRPAAFANSPGFPREEWQHLRLLSLSRPVITRYAHKWLEGRAAEARERRDVLSVLDEKLGQSHIRDLARNPMQLTILLALISVQGASLPDKRTALYDKYIDIFLNRESEKSRVVRDHRDLLIQIHRFLAWTLQAEVEVSGTGHISEAQLKDTLRTYLEAAGHSSALIDQLFTGIVERVVALVSRVQGTFEFEVQPLREYFAARHLYDTAPYSPAGTDKRGALPDRFDAIARNFYWLNVTRFYSGCYSSGELASLLEGLEDLRSSEQFRYIGHGSQLGATLLNDHVFSQQPRLAKRLAQSIIEDRSFRILLANNYERRVETLTLPPGSPRDLLVEKCKEVIETTGKWDFQIAASQVLKANIGGEAARTYWQSLAGRIRDDRWLTLGGSLGVYSRLQTGELIKLAEQHPAKIIRQTARFDRSDLLEQAPELWQNVLEEVLEGVSFPLHALRRAALSPEQALTFYISALTLPYMPFERVSETKDVPLRRLIERGPYTVPDWSAEPQQLHFSGEQDIRVTRTLEAFEELMGHQVGELRAHLELWSRAVETGRAQFGTRWALARIAIVAAQLDNSNEVTDADLTNDESPLCWRALSAKLKAEDGSWWDRQLKAARKSDPVTTNFVLACLHLWAPLAVKLELLEDIGVLVDALPTSSWQRLMTNFDRPGRIMRGRRASVAKAKLTKSVSPRAATFLLGSVLSKDAYTVWERYLTDYEGDDLEVHRASMRAVLARAEKAPTKWSMALRVVSKGYDAGISFQAYRPNRPNRDIQVPSDVAKQVCSTPEIYPSWLVSSAESVLAAETGSVAIPVIKIAARDEWFAD